MVNYIRGKFGRSASEQFAKDLRRQSRFGKLPSINKKEREQVIEMVEKVFKGKTKFKQSDLEKEVLNRLRISHKDLLDSKEIGEVDRVMGLTDHSKKIGTKYLSVLRQEKKEEYQKHLEALKAEKEKAIEFKKEQNMAESEKIKLKEEPSKNISWLERLAVIKSKTAEQDQARTGVPRSAGNNSRFGGMPQDPYAKNDNRNGGHNEHKTPNPTVPEHREGFSREAPPSHDLPRGGDIVIPHAEPPTVSEFNK